jgi:hypothetical protein
MYFLIVSSHPTIFTNNITSCQETKKGIVKVGSSCSEFYDKDLYRMGELPLSPSHISLEPLMTADF